MSSPDPAAAGEEVPAGPPPLALLAGMELVTRYRLRLTDPGDSRLGELRGNYLLSAAQWTGRRAAFVGFYRPPAQGAAEDLEGRVRAAERWAEQRLSVQGAERCDVLLVALAPVEARISANRTARVAVGAASVDPVGAGVTIACPLPGGLPGAGELRAWARALRDGRPAPTLAAVDLAERQTVASGYVAPARRALTTTAYATFGLIGAIVAMYLAERALFGEVRGGRRVDYVSLGALLNHGSAAGDWWRYVSSAFLHDAGSIDQFGQVRPTGFSYLHILGNCWALYVLGRPIEQLWGRLVLVATFLVTAVGGGLFWVACAALGIAHQGGPGFGASGGVFGLMGLLFMLGRVQGRDVPAGLATTLRQYVFLFAAINIALGFTLSGVNNFAHVGGFLSGCLVGLIVPPVEAVGGRRLRLVEQGALLLICAAALAAMGVEVKHIADLLSLPRDTLPVLG